MCSQNGICRAGDAGNDDVALATNPVKRKRAQVSTAAQRNSAEYVDHQVMGMAS